MVRKEAEVGALIREFEDTKAQNSELKAELEALRRRAKQGQEEQRAKVGAPLSRSPLSSSRIASLGSSSW